MKKLIYELIKLILAIVILICTVVGLYLLLV
nr:MAG TPA: hypothetical protein [Caudoviricetes sp.]